ncbi:acyl carrier protein [Beggiatoa leptomitoformis]|uniref:Acyl carrier protein n=1 Tax=Beggiatoa leptomitoformis TaxID=288004 RepID=A0A2N9YBK4_9GAMM|nr:acyl carrier protein [Beggiatoa leptomitoformis]ALG66848.1 acyl carrier protein [Beggiatoa leptomitoformis]AUI67799.1 acyl carrier protein [Beggiatoa leptomitoformis]
MENEKIIEQLREIIANRLDVNLRLEEVDAQISLFEGGLGLDSIAIMEFISLIEDGFGIKFGEDELNMDYFKNLDTVAQFVSNKLTVH